ncbi:hypothetical protein BU24DRAFT_331295, partial [Aaosphaeria arxii CBS 175.79]
WPRSHYEMIEYHHQKRDEAIQAGQIQPFLYPWGTLGAAVVIVYLLIPHQNRPWLKKARFLVFAFNAGFSIYCILYTRARIMAGALGLGLISAWSICWTFALLVVNDAQTDFQRIERTEGVFGLSSTAKKEEKNKTITSNGNTDPILQGILESNGSVTTNGHTTHEHLGPSQRHGTFAWQPFPITPFIERLDWVLDIFTNFRGVGWNWRTSSQPPPPKPVLNQLNSSSSTSPPAHHTLHTHPTQPTVHPTRRSLLLANLKTLLLGYLTLDILKTLMNHDPYFWGATHLPPLPSLPLGPLVPILTSSPSLLQTYRLTLSMLGVKSALQTIFALGPLFFAGALGPAVLGARASPWMYPDAWGPYGAAVLDRGLRGWWGGWWHQTFRFAFEAPATYLLNFLPQPSSDGTKGGRKGRRRGTEMLVRLTTAFAMSGALHAGGMHTSNASLTHPLTSTALFFVLQVPGVMFEAALIAPCVDRLPGPRWGRRVLRFVYVHAWFYATAGLVCRDFARSGVWLFEPVPVSVVRGPLVGWGVEGDGWWCWGKGLGDWVRWE